MDSSPTAPSILGTLRTVEFRLGLKGYNVDEVDEYLDRAAQEAEAVLENVRQLNDRLRQASERIVQLEKDKRSVPTSDEGGSPAAAGAPAAAAVDNGLSDETLQRTLILAQKFVEQTKRESEAEAAAIVEQAEERARTAMSQAEEKARAAVAAAEQAALAMQTEAQQNLRDEVTRLELSRTELASDVESMARHLESERNRLRDALSEILKWVDENVQPASSLMGARAKGKLPAKASRGGGNGTNDAPAEASLKGADDDAPTLNLQTVANDATSGASRPL